MKSNLSVKATVGSPAIVAILGGWLMAANSTCAQNWTQATNAPAGNYLFAVASSADGNKLVLTVANPGESGPIYVSTNFGATWDLTSAPSNRWFRVASSADGTTLIAGGASTNGNMPLYTSNDSGLTWNSNDLPMQVWRAVACSADGTKLFAATDGGNLPPNPPSVIYKSTNSGATWTATSAPNQQWWSMDCSADGTKVLAAAFSTSYTQGNVSHSGSPAPIYVSSDSGETWTVTTAPSNFWRSVACSADGTKIVAAIHDLNPIYTSTNSGATWTMTSRSAWSVTSSADGTRFAAAGTDGNIYTSTNFGGDWISNSAPVKPWIAIASSADGAKLVALAATGAHQGVVYTGQFTPAPVLNLTPSAMNLALSWLIPSMNFALQQNADLSTTNWSDVSTPPVLDLTNLQYRVTLSPADPRGFFRLKTP